MEYKCALVIGAGAFGTAIANVLANNFEKVVLKVRSEDVYSSLQEGENSIYLPDLPMAKNLVPALTWEEADELMNGETQLIVSGLPTEAMADFYKENYDYISSHLNKGVYLTSLSKGIDSNTLELADDLFFDYWPNHRELFTFLSGPSFAQEIMQKQITMVTLAGRSYQTLKIVSKMFETSYFKALASYDVKGVLLGGALKNVIAIAGGTIEGLGYNYNTRAAMLTRGITEMLRFGLIFNARPETFYGLSGMGDLILSTTGNSSRNKRFGLEIAKGRSPQEIIKSQRAVVEGYKTAKSAQLIAKKYSVRMGIFDGVYQVLYEGVDPKDIIDKLMKMQIRFEGY